MRTDVTDQEIAAAAENCRSMREAAQVLNLPYRTFIYKAQKLGVYKPNPNPKGKDNLSVARIKYIEENTIPLDEILNGEHPTYRGHALKLRLYETGVKHEQCEECGQGNVWNGKPLTLELEHVNGNNRDHRLENLRILCMHCHSQTPTFRRRKSALVV